MQPETLDHVFLALCDPGRRAMIERLCEQPASVKELATPIGMRLPSAVKHLRVLEDSGLVMSHKQGRVRTYQISPTAFSIINEWIAHRQAAMHAAFDRLDQAIADFPEEDHE